MLQVEKVTRMFGDTKVLDDISFEVEPGRLTGFVGANGAGKTTTMRIILGVLGAHGGEVRWRGEPVTQRQRQRFGYMPEERGLYPKMKVAEQITYLGRLHGLTTETARRNTDRLLERLDLTGRADDPVEKLSLGNQQRAQVAAALVHDPAFLMLDEPFSGLDPIAVEVVLDALRERSASGVPVLFSSHQLDVVERLCDNLVIVSDGRIVAHGSRAELRSRFGTSQYEIIVGSDAGWIRDLPEIRVVELDGPRAVFELADPSRATALSEQTGQPEQLVLQSALRHGPVHSFAPVVPSLSEIFRELV